MPEISRFLGIVIGMFYGEHDVPHFHVVYGEHEAPIEAHRGTVSLPFDPGEHKRIAVKIVDDRGIESLKVMELE